MPKTQRRLDARANTWTQPQTFVDALTVLVDGQPIRFRPHCDRSSGNLVIGLEVEVDGQFKLTGDRTNPA